MNISSTASLHGNWGLFCVVKAAVEGLTRSLAAEGAPHGIRANSVSPGWIDVTADPHSPPADGADWDVPPSLFNRMGSPAETAAVRCISGQSRGFFCDRPVPHRLIVDGGLSVVDYTSLAILRRLGARSVLGRTVRDCRRPKNATDSLPEGSGSRH
ncbi:SDR family oxidoreductase [Mesorhizobium sp. M0700]|uniref:SDR family oxidoreductase n=1 Tax=Mesorhizobium sp. M0700 TaxID=2956988 RepID=UPI003335A5DD